MMGISPTSDLSMMIIIIYENTAISVVMNLFLRQECELLNPHYHLTGFHKVKRCLDDHEDLLNDEGLVGLADRFSSGAIRAVGVTYMRSGGFRPLWNYYPGEARLNWGNQVMEVPLQEPP